MSSKQGVAVVAALLAAAPAYATTYYVDYANGNDANSGKSTSSAWKHAPGDLKATSVPASVKLVGGDIVRFRAGVSYRGSIRMKASGTAAAPITYTGMGWGSGRAIIDGADPVKSTVNCPSKSACGGAPNWASLKLVTFNKPVTDEVVLFDEKGLLYQSQYPAPADPFWDDDLASYVVTPRGQAQMIESGRLENATLAAKAAASKGDLYLSFWIYGNLIERRKITSVSGNSIYFTPAGLTLYKDRDGRVALVGSPSTLTRKGSFALLRTDRAVVLPHDGGGKIMVGTGRNGFDTQSLSNIVIDGFHFMRGFGQVGKPTEGVAIMNGRYTYGTNWKISNNIFGPSLLAHGGGMIRLGYVDGVNITGNSFENIQRGSGVRGGSARNIIFSKNHITRVGRTGFYLGGVENANVNNNIVHDIRGIHGNGMSFYLANKNVTVQNNCIYDSDRPITYNGTNQGAASVVNNLVIRNNILVGSKDAVAAINSWGANARNVQIIYNTLLSPRYGLRMHASDIGLTVAYNRTSGLTTQGVAPTTWRIMGNISNAAMSTTAAAGILTPTACRMPGYTGQLSTTIK